MYLKLLKDEEKRAFLELACNLSAADGDIGENEKNMISEYCNEMEISYGAVSENTDVDSIIDIINEISDEKTKKIIVFELVGLALCDGKYDEREKQMILEIAEKINVGVNMVEQFESKIKSYISIQSEINSLLLG